MQLFSRGFAESAPVLGFFYKNDHMPSPQTEYITAVHNFFAGGGGNVPALFVRFPGPRPFQKYILRRKTMGPNVFEASTFGGRSRSARPPASSVYGAVEDASDGRAMKRELSPYIRSRVTRFWRSFDYLYY
jgi:hypothetical protein